MIQIFDQEIPNKMSELTIEQFEKISQILNNQDFDNIEKYVEMFKYLGIKEEMWDDYPFSEFIKLVQDFNQALEMNGLIAEMYGMYVADLAQKFPILELGSLLRRKPKVIYDFVPLYGDFNYALDY